MPPERRGTSRSCRHLPTFPAKFQVRRAEVDNGRLDMLVDTTARANGDEVDIEFHARGERHRFTQRIENDCVRFRQLLPRSQRSATAGIVTLSYRGNAVVRPTEVRLRAAGGRAQLQRNLLALENGTLTARGSVSRRADGVVRLDLSYDRPDGLVGSWNGQARIENSGDWSMSEELPAEARGGGYLTIQFTGYLPERIRGEQIAKQLFAGQRFEE